METNKPWEDYKDRVLDRIKELESELVGLKAELTKPKKFEFKYSNDSYLIYSDEVIPEKFEIKSEAGLKKFRYRQTEANAKADFQLQKELMCIGALAEQIDPDYKTKVNWRSPLISPCFIGYDLANCCFGVFSSSLSRHLGVVYMPKDVAEKVCEILNNKEVEL